MPGGICKVRHGMVVFMPWKPGFVEDQLGSTGIEKKISGLIINLSFHQDELIADLYGNNSRSFRHLIIRAGLDKNKRQQEEQ